MKTLMQRLTWLKPFSLTALLLFGSVAGYADDTEIYFTKSNGAGAINIMFLMDTSGSMKDAPPLPTSETRSKLQILKDVFGPLVDGMGGNINVGLSAFDANGKANGAYVLYPIRNLDAQVNKLIANSAVNNGEDDTDGLVTTAGDLPDYTNKTLKLGGWDGTQVVNGTGMIFRKLAVPSNATIKSATLTVSANGTQNTGGVALMGLYSVRLDPNSTTPNDQPLPNFSQKGLYVPGFLPNNPMAPTPGAGVGGAGSDRVWGPTSIVDNTTLAPVTLGTVPSSVTDSKLYNIDVTALVQAAVNDSGWCGNNDMLLNVIHRVVSQYAVVVGSVETGNNNYPAPKLSVEWDINPVLTSGTTCQGGIVKALGNPQNSNDTTNDAQQAGSTVTVSGNSGKTITLKKGSNYGGFRFPGLNYDPSDTVVSATLRLTGQGSMWTESAKQCQIYVSRKWYDIPSNNYPSPDQLGVTFPANCGKNYCDQLRRGSCRSGYSYPTDENTVSNDVGIPSGKTVTLHVSVVKGDAAAITTSSNNLSSRTILASQDFTVSASDADWRKNIDLDVTSLTQQAMNAGNGWTKGAALMFVVNAINLPDDSAEFSIGTQESGQAASLTLKLTSKDQSEFGGLMVRDQLKQSVQGLSASGGTPTLESLTEVTRYMLGQAPYFGTSSIGTASNPDSIASGNYISPIAPANQSCSSNHIIVMTDGVSGSDGDGPTQAQNVTDKAITCAATDGGTGTTIDGRDYQCMTKLAGWLNVAENNAIKRQVSTDMIAFGVGTNVNYQDRHCTTKNKWGDCTAYEFPESDDPMVEIKKVTDAGGGLAKKADSADELLQSFQSIINAVVDANSTMAAPGVAVNQLNRLQYLNQLYYAVFKPKAFTVWPGNMKKYGLGGTVESPVITDANNSPAVDPNTGFFSNTAKSYWSSSADGKEVNKGGAFEVMQKAQANAQNGGYGRSLFITETAGSIGNNIFATSPSATALKAVTAWDTLTGAQLGLTGADATDTTARKNVMSWLMTAWGDPLHSEPQLINYGYTGDDYAAAAEDPSKQNNVVFVSDNDGILHAIDSNTGVELFAFSPAEQVVQAAVRQKIEANGAPSYDANKTVRPIYGLDANWTFWRQANPSDPSTVKSVYAYGGQRRGGSNYYALDVTAAGFGNTNPQPKLIWQISQVTGTPFELLGETWSQPQLAKIKVAGKDLPVLIFAGGYDSAVQDVDGVVSTGDKVGNAIYIVNANTGALVWYASNGSAKMGSGDYGYTSNTDMKWSIPSAPAVVDVDGDGYADFIYVGDTHGQIFRVALDNFNNKGADTLVNSVTTFAKVGPADANDVTNNRRFYYAPSLALAKRNNVDILQLVIGSGYRAHPLSESVQDWAFEMDDIVALPLLQAIKSKGSNSITEPTLEMKNLVDVSSLDAGSNVTIDDGGSGLGIYGWRVKMDQTSGEKILSESAILQGTVVFTTFINEVKDIDKCTSVAGGARLYAVNLNDGLAIPGFISGTAVDGTHGRAQNLNIPGIPPKPQVLLTNLPHDSDYVPPADLNPLCGSLATSLTGIVGTSAVSLGSVNQCGLQRTGWYETTPTKVKDAFDKEGAK